MPPYVRSLSSSSSSSGLAPPRPCPSPPSSSSSSSLSSRQRRSDASNVDDAASRKGDILLRHAAAELEDMRVAGINRRRAASAPPREGEEEDEIERPFPPACLRLILSLPGNSRCNDCDDASSTTWASVSHGITLCQQCSGRHRRLGVRTSQIKSLMLDHWKRREILCMLEGGNSQLTAFFDRHGIDRGGYSGSTTTASASDRYETDEASFYRGRLVGYVGRIARGGAYEGREASRVRRNGGGETRTEHRIEDGTSLSVEGRGTVRATEYDRE